MEYEGLGGEQPGEQMLLSSSWSCRPDSEAYDRRQPLQRRRKSMGGVLRMWEKEQEKDRREGERAWEEFEDVGSQPAAQIQSSGSE